MRGLSLTLLLLHKHKKGLSTDLTWTSVPATNFTKMCCTIVFSSRTILPISVHEEGWKSSSLPRLPNCSPNNSLPFCLPKAAHICRAAFAVPTASIPTLLPTKGMGKAAGMADKNAQMGTWQGKEWETLTCNLFAQHFISGRSNVSFAEGRREEPACKNKFGVGGGQQLFAPQF